MVSCCAALAAMALPVPADAVPGRGPGQAGIYKGKTGQNRVIVFRLSHRGVFDLRHFSIQLRCRDGSVLVDQESDFESSALSAGGTFHEDQVGSTDEVWFRGPRAGGS